MAPEPFLTRDRPRCGHSNNRMSASPGSGSEWGSFPECVPKTWSCSIWLVVPACSATAGCSWCCTELHFSPRVHYKALPSTTKHHQAPPQRHHYPAPASRLPCLCLQPSSHLPPPASRLALVQSVPTCPKCLIGSARADAGRHPSGHTNTPKHTQLHTTAHSCTQLPLTAPSLALSKLRSQAAHAAHAASQPRIHLSLVTRKISIHSGAPAPRLQHHLLAEIALFLRK